jgi:hypothetical protein
VESPLTAPGPFARAAPVRMVDPARCGRTLNNVPFLSRLRLPSLVGKRHRGHLLFAARELAARRRLGAKALLGALGEGGSPVMSLTADPTAHPHWELTLDGGQRVCFDVAPDFSFDQLVHLVASEADVRLVGVADGPAPETMELTFDAAGRELRVVVNSYCLP